jgi:hypothetical protein
MIRAQDMALAGWPAACPQYRVRPARSATRPAEPITYRQRWPRHRFLVRGELAQRELPARGAGEPTPGRSGRVPPPLAIGRGERSDGRRHRLVARGPALSRAGAAGGDRHFSVGRSRRAPHGVRPHQPDGRYRALGRSDAAGPVGRLLHLVRPPQQARVSDRHARTIRSA